MDFKVIDLFKFYFKNIMLALLSFGISLGCSYYYFFEVYEPEYIANTTIMLGANEVTTDIGFNQKVIKNYLELVKSKNVLDNIIKKTELNYTNSQLKGMISASFAEDTEFITISVISKDEEDSAKLSYAVYEGLVAEVERIFKINNIHLVDTDSIGDVKYSDKLLFLLVLGLSFGGSFCVTTINYLFFPNFNLQRKINNFRKYLKNKIIEKKEIQNAKKEKKKQEEREREKKEFVKESNTKKQVVKKKTKTTSEKTSTKDIKKNDIKKRKINREKKPLAKKGSKKND